MRLRTKRFLQFGVGVLAAAMALVVVVSIITSAVKSSQVRDTQQSNTTKIDATNRILHIIVGCTTPGRRCYRRGKQQVAGAVSDIGHVSVVAAYCASIHPGDLPLITQCVSRQLLTEQRPTPRHR